MACYFCEKNIKQIDFRNTKILKIFISGLGKIRPKRKTGVCAKHQRQLSRAVKRARHLGLMSYTSK